MVKIEGKEEDKGSPTRGKGSSRDHHENGNSGDKNGGANGSVVPSNYQIVATKPSGPNKRTSFTGRKLDQKKVNPQGPFPAHKVKYDKPPAEIEWPKNAKFFELVEVYLPALDIPDQAKREAKRRERRRAAKMRRKKKKKKKKVLEMPRSALSDTRDATMQTDPDLDGSVRSTRSTRDIEITLASIRSSEPPKSVKSMEERGRRRDTEGETDGERSRRNSERGKEEGAWARGEEDEDEDDEDADEDSSDDTEVDESDSDTEIEGSDADEQDADVVDGVESSKGLQTPTASSIGRSTRLDLSASSARRKESTPRVETPGEAGREDGVSARRMESTPRVHTSGGPSRDGSSSPTSRGRGRGDRDRTPPPSEQGDEEEENTTSGEATPRKKRPKGKSSGKSSSRSSRKSSRVSVVSTTEDDEEEEIPKPGATSASASRAESPASRRTSVPVEERNGYNSSATEERNDMELPPNKKELAEEEKTALEVRQIYKDEVVELFNHMNTFRIQCNKESAKYHESMEKKKQKIREDIIQLKRDRDALKASIEVEYIKNDTDLIRKKDDLLKKGAWILEMEEKLKQRKETLKEWEDEMDEIEGYLSRRYEFAKRKEDNIAEVEEELRKLREMMEDEKASIENAELDNDEKRSKKAQVHWDFVQKATMEKEQLLELAIKRHKKRAEDMESKVREKNEAIESLDDTVKKLQEDLAKKELKLKELDSHLSVVLHENVERDRDSERASRRSSVARGSTLNVPGTSGLLSRTTSTDTLSRSRTLPVKGSKRYGGPVYRVPAGGAAVNETPGTVVGYTGAGLSGYSAGSSRGNVVVPGTSGLSQLPRPRDRGDTRIEFNKGPKNSRSCVVM